jgi:hypothetical protein
MGDSKELPQIVERALAEALGRQLLKLQAELVMAEFRALGSGDTGKRPRPLVGQSGTVNLQYSCGFDAERTSSGIAGCRQRLSHARGPFCDDEVIKDFPDRSGAPAAAGR